MKTINISNENKELGTIFNIQKFSIHDGPGIRTTVFFKGCPLRCKWCANPESQLCEIQILHDSGKCTQCQKCIETYPELGLKLDGKDIIIPKSLDNFEFIEVCPNSAFTIEGELKTAQEIVNTCLQDQPFYEESNGGVTFSGGESLIQPEFLLDLINKLKEKNIHTAVETTGAINHQTFKKVISEIDYILFDIKHYDSKKHKEGTGLSNKLILENLKWLIKNNKKFLCRIPVIPEFNDSIEDAIGFTKLLKSLGIEEIQLLPFHQFGERKYDLLKENYKYKGVPAYHPEELEEFRTTFINEGINCYF